MIKYRPLAPTLALLLAGALALPARAAVDEAAAEALATKSNCFKCHTVDKPKDGPAYKEVAAKYKGKPEAAEKLYKHATTRPIVKVGGNEEEHATLKSKNPEEIKNVIQWILTR